MSDACSVLMSFPLKCHEVKMLLSDWVKN